MIEPRSRGEAVVANQTVSEHLTEAAPTTSQRCAAAYVRMSTDHQRYSIGSQIRAIQAFADRNQLKVVRIYKDEGKSGLTFSEREGLAQLIADIIAGRNDFSDVLVFDISRWGRFQDLDESAHYEFLCRRNGVRVTYCEDVYVNDGNPYSAVIKVLKRAQAADDSRIKSARVFATLCELANSGLHTGGPAPYGFVRVAIDQNRQRMQRLTPGTQRAIRADKIILMKGNRAQIRVVRQIFDLYVNRNVSALDIASRLNAGGIASPRGGRWSRTTIISMLSNQVYAGIKCWNRATSRLKTKRRKNDQSSWILRRIFKRGIIDPKQFERAQQIRASRGRSARKSDGQLLAEFKELTEKYGPLPTKWFGLAPGLSSPSTYVNRFGSIKRVFELTGATCSKRRLLWQRMLMARKTTTWLLDAMKLEAEKSGDSIEVIDDAHIVHAFRFNMKLLGHMVLLERKKDFKGRFFWRYQMGRRERPNVYVIGLLGDSSLPFKYYVVPSASIGVSIAIFREERLALGPGLRPLESFVRASVSGVVDELRRQMDSCVIRGTPSGSIV